MATNNFSPRFTNFDALSAYLTAQGTAFKKSIPLYTIGSDGNDSNIIGHWGYNSANAIAPMGEILLSNVSATKYAVVESVVDGVVTLTNGHNLGSSFYGLLWDVSAASEILHNVACSVASNVLTVAGSIGALAAGDLVYDVNSSEFSIGGSTRNFRPKANCAKAYFSSGLKLVNGSLSAHIGTFGFNKQSYSVNFFFSWAKTSDVNAQLAVAGFQRADGQISTSGFYRTLNQDTYAGFYGPTASVTGFSLVGTITTMEHLRVYPTVNFIMADIVPADGTTPAGRCYQNLWQMTEAPNALYFIAQPASTETVTLTLTKVR